MQLKHGDTFNLELNFTISPDGTIEFPNGRTMKLPSLLASVRESLTAQEGKIWRGEDNYRKEVEKDFNHAEKMCFFWPYVKYPLPKEKTEEEEDTALEPTEPVVKDKCTCDITDLMKNGCVCGNIERYKPPDP